MIDDAIAASIEESVLCWLATADAQGRPNVSPKEVFARYGDRHLLIAHIASPASVRNIGENPHVCVSFVDVFKQKGYKLKGSARIIGKHDTGFNERHAPLYQLAGDRFPIRAVIEIEITETAPIVAPSYYLYPDTTEASQVDSAMHTYGVQARL